VNPIRTGRAVLFLLPYVLIVAGVLVAGQKAGSPGGTAGALQALAVAAVGVIWAYLRARRTHR
jgi:hypothetical protein